MSRPRAVLTGAISDRALGRLSAHMDIVRVSRLATDAELAMAFRHAEALLNVGQFPVTAAVLDLAPRLKVVSMRAVGYDSVDMAACAARGIVICNTPGVLDTAVAELTVLLMLAVARDLGNLIRESVQAGQGGSQPLGTDLTGKTLGIIGMGRIGRRVAAMAQAAFAMPVCYAARSEVTGAPGVRVELDELLAASDVVSLHLPLNERTAGIIGRREFALMRQGSYLINTARGGLVDEAALHDALSTGRLAGAGLDTLAHEPARSEEPLLRLPNVIVTPHVGSATVQTRAAMDEMAITNLLEVLAGRRPLARVELYGETGGPQPTHTTKGL